MIDLVDKRCSVTGGPYEGGSFGEAVHEFIASPPDEQQAALVRLFAAPSAVFQWFGGLLGELDAHTRDATAREGYDVGLQRMHDKWLAVAVVLLNNGFPVEARVAAQSLYQVIRSLEVERAERFPKGTVLWWLGRTCQEGDAPEQAKNYFLLAMLEDVRTDISTWTGLPARDWLLNRTQLAAETVDEIGRDFAAAVSVARWEPREPEIAWVKSRPHRRRVICANLDFSKAVAGAFRTSVHAPSPTRKEQGDRLELLVSYLFAVEPGFEVLGPTKSSDSQNDVLVRNRHHDAAIAALGDYFIVECKNWGDPVGASVVRELAGKMRAAKVRTGILVSREGITGQKEKSQGTGARETIAKEYLQDATAVLVLNDGANTSPTLRPTISARRRPVPRATEKMRWSRTLPAVARRIRRCSSVVSVVGLKCGT